MWVVKPRERLGYSGWAQNRVENTYLLRENRASLERPRGSDFGLGHCRVWTTAGPAGLLHYA